MSYSHQRAILNTKGEVVDFEFLETNELYASQTSFAAAELPGKSLSEVFPQLTPEDFDWMIPYAINHSEESSGSFERYCLYHKCWYKIHYYTTGDQSVIFIYEDISEAKLAEMAREDVKRQHEVLSELTTSVHYTEGNIYAFIKLAIEKASEAMKVWRTGVWFFDQDGDKLRNFDNYDAETGIHSSGKSLTGFKYNSEFKHLKKHRFVDAHDALNDKRVSGYLQDYLVPLGISSMLDVGIISDGITKGILSFEHKGEKRTWQPHEITFGCQVTGLIASVLGVFDKKIAQNKLQTTENKLKSIFRTAPSGMGLVVSRVFQEVNDKLCQMTGYSREELIGKSARMLYCTDEDYEYVGNEKYRQIDEFGIGTVETRFRRKDGQILYVLLSSSPLDAKNRMQGITFTATDVTSHMLAEEKLRISEKRYQSIVETQSEMICRFLPDTTLTFVNAAYCNYFRKNEQDLLGKKFLDLLPDPNQKLMKEHLLFFSPQSAEHIFENKILLKNGRYVWQEWATVAIFDASGNLLEFQSIGNDITDKKERTKLEQELKVALESGRFKKNFLANMSHEMRTPLTGIIGMTEILAQTKLNLQQQEYLRLLRHSGENLMELINQVLDFSHIEKGALKLKYRKMDLHRLLKRAEKYFVVIGRPDIGFESLIDETLPRCIKADRVRLEQILHNLISNAVKFTLKGHVRMVAKLVKLYPPGELLIKVSVYDTGIGIPENRQKEIFEPFMQVDSLDTREYEGTGLGLSICKNLVMLHGGKIGFESTVGQGSCFWFTFKAYQTKEDNTATEENEKVSEIKPLRILFAEDKKINQKVISLILRSMGHTVTIAENGKEALEIFKQSDFDLIFMDIQMPEMDGVTAVRELKATYAKLPPIIGLSANAFEGDKEKYMDMGMDDYLTKPVKKSELEELFKKWFP